MTVNSIGAATGVSMSAPSAPSNDITKSGLEALRDRITKNGGQVPAGLDTLIEKFDDAAGSSGTMTREQFKSFAESNGVALPQHGKEGGHHAGGARGAGGGGQVGAPSGSPSGGGGGVSASDDMSSSTNVAGASDAELKELAAKGDTAAILELQKREASRKELNPSVGNTLDEYA